MVIRGRVHNGVVVLEAPAVLSEGTEVSVQPLAPNGKKAKASKKPTVSRALARLAGKAKGLPSDASQNVDHYLYGHAKR
jgi:hypothetical protein